ncbi:MAG: hypothetical protein BGO43_11340 [Gammaproteobacteria bacterium 39-13]|nr:hypothetical protein [Gammaproteobacteria bacterium]OJV85228.1 MAG: hypothetical protein BGO43_11340 [Gammaproteobacteria bacterium 39-13]
MKPGVKKALAPKAKPPTQATPTTPITVTPAAAANVANSIKTNLETRWARLDARAKKFALILGSAMSFALALLYGPTIFYLLIFVIGGGAYALFPDKIDNWIDNHQWLLGFAAFGTLFTGPLGFIAGAWLGNFLEPHNNRLTATAVTVYEHTSNLSAVANAPSSAFQSIKSRFYNGWQWTKNKLTGSTQSPAASDVTTGNDAQPGDETRRKRPKSSQVGTKSPDAATSSWRNVFSYFSRNKSPAITPSQTTVSTNHTGARERSNVTEDHSLPPKPPAKNRVPDHLKKKPSSPADNAGNNQIPPRPPAKNQLPAHLKRVLANTDPAPTVAAPVIASVTQRPKRRDASTRQRDAVQSNSAIANPAASLNTAGEQITAPAEKNDSPGLIGRLFGWIVPMPDFEDVDFGEERSNAPPAQPSNRITPEIRNEVLENPSRTVRFSRPKTREQAKESPSETPQKNSRPYRNNPQRSTIS